LTSLFITSTSTDNDLRLRVNSILGYSPSLLGVARRQMITRFSCPPLNAVGYAEIELVGVIDDLGSNWVSFGGGILVFSSTNGTTVLSRRDLLYFTPSPCVSAGTFLSTGACLSCPLGAFCPSGLCFLLCLPPCLPPLPACLLAGWAFFICSELILCFWALFP
jgi:hypothetical protein